MERAIRTIFSDNLEYLCKGGLPLTGEKGHGCRDWYDLDSGETYFYDSINSGSSWKWMPSARQTARPTCCWKIQLLLCWIKHRICGVTHFLCLPLDE